MEILLQPTKSRTCGQHCVAMVAGISVLESIELFGHKNGTTPKMVSEVFKKLGYKQAKRKLFNFAYEKQLPKVCLLCIHWDKSGGHWVVYNNGDIYCPGKGIYKYNLKNIHNQKGRASHFLFIGEKTENVINE